VDELDPARQGWIPGAQLRSGEKLLSLSVTSLETLAKCPFRFWGERIARLEALPLASWTGTITPLERGNLVHASLAALVQNHPGASIQSIAQKAATRGDIESSLESLPPEYLRLSLLPESIRRALLRDIVETVSSYLAALVEGDCRDGIPEAAECRLVADIPSLPGCTLVGVVDRIDVADGKARVVDYKTSKSPFRKRGRPEEAEEVACGFLLQPSLYPWLVENSLKRPVEGFSYVYLGDPPPVEVHFDRIPPADELFRQFKPILENRLFVPTPNEFYAAIERDNLQSCRYCEFVSLCRRFDRVSMGTVIKLMSQRASARFRVLHGASSAEGPNVDH
jgi:ATP-dependent helicase/DNAse subunit B